MPWLELARFDLLARNGLCAMALLDSQTNVISFGFQVLMGVRLYFCSLWVCFLEKSHPAYWVTGLAALCVQTGEYSKKGKLVHTLRPVKWVSYIWPKGQCWREGSCGVYVPEGGAQLLMGWRQQGQRNVVILIEWHWFGKEGYFMSFDSYSCVPLWILFSNIAVVLRLSTLHLLFLKPVFPWHTSPHKPLCRKRSISMQSGHCPWKDPESDLLQHLTLFDHCSCSIS